MGIWLKVGNIVLFVLAVILGVFVFPHSKITQEVLELFPQNADREIIEVYREFASSRYVLVASEGFSQNSQENLKAFLARTEDLPNVATTFTHTQTPQGLEDFIARHYVAIASPTHSLQNLARLSQEQITSHIVQGVQSLLRAQDGAGANTESRETRTKDSQSPTTPPSFNPHDPLGLFSLPARDSKELIAKDYGLLGVVELKSIESEALKPTIVGFQSIAKDFPTIRYFSQNFMDSLNLTLTLEEVGFLLTFSSIVFVVLYFVIIRIPMLTLHTIATLVLANVIAMFVVANIYPKVTIMALTFGMGISNIAIDYMMHHNFFGLYASKRRRFNAPVFYGYMTTIVGFGICLFVPFPLLAQLSLYAILSLSVSYCSFAFVYPYMGFRAPRFFPTMARWRTQSLSKWWFLALCVASMGFVATHLHFDFDLSKLGYHNKEQIKEREFFANAYERESSQILLSHKDLQGLLTLANALQRALNAQVSQSFIPLSLLPDSARLESNRELLESPAMRHNVALLQRALPPLKNAMLAQISPKDEERKAAIETLFETMQSAYDPAKLKDLEHLRLEALESLGFRVIERGGVLYYLTSIHTEDLPLVRQIAREELGIQAALDSKGGVGASGGISGVDSTEGGIETRSLQELLSHITDSLYAPMLIMLGIALTAMLVTLALSARGKFLECAVFVLFPLTSALFVISTHSALDILHLFALLILVVVSVDYGIYAAKEGLNLRTTHAIFFSAITTGVSFGILMLGNTKAIVSFGEVMFVGMACILVLLFWLKSGQARQSR